MISWTIGCVSDTHGNVKRMRRAVESMGRVAVVLHAGDFYRDAEALAEAGVQVYGVVGNCDYWTLGPKERVVEFGGHRILLTHGHQYRVKRGLEQLVERALELGVRICVFGHTHVALIEEAGGVLLVNPGSVAQPRSPAVPTCAVLDCSRARPEARLVFVDAD